MGRKQLTDGGEIRQNACEACGGDIARRQYADSNGVLFWEGYSRFMQRPYCSTECGHIGNGRRQAEAAARKREILARQTEIINQFIYGR